MDTIKLASDILRQVAVELEPTNSYYVVGGKRYPAMDVDNLADRLAALALIRSPEFAGLVDEVERLREEMKWRTDNWTRAIEAERLRKVAAEAALHKERMLTDEVVFKLQAADGKLADMTDLRDKWGAAAKKCRAIIEAQNAKLAAAEADAGRYRWLRLLGEEQLQVVGTWGASGDPEALDEGCDAATGGGK